MIGSRVVVAIFAVWIAAGNGTAGAAGSAASAGDSRYLPDPRLTPGAVISTHTADICARGYDRAHRVWHDKSGTLAKYRIPQSAAGQFEDDDLVPVCLGGANEDPANHWAQPNAGQWAAADKDTLEKQVCTEICLTRDDAQLAKYQAAFAKDWVALYQQVMVGKR